MHVCTCVHTQAHTWSPTDKFMSRLLARSQPHRCPLVGISLRTHPHLRRCYYFFFSPSNRRHVVPLAGSPKEVFKFVCFFLLLHLDFYLSDSSLTLASRLGKHTLCDITKDKRSPCFFDLRNKCKVPHRAQQ